MEESMASEPTLYHGNRSVDGWVEYLQELLLEKTLKSSLGDHEFQAGVFDDATLTAVKKFQETKRLKVDGIVGDQTWAALQGEAAPFPRPGDDGRKRGAHVEHGVEMRFTDWLVYSDSQDELTLGAFSVGDVQPESGTVDPLVTITRRDGTSDYVAVRHEFHELTHYFHVPEVTGGVPGEYRVRAELPDHTGGDTIERTFARETT